MLQAGVKHGLRPRLHAGQLADVGAVELAVELRAASADHLDHCTRESRRRYWRRPGWRVSCYRQPRCRSAPIHPPGCSGMRGHRGAGHRLQPGTSFVERMPFVVALGVLELGLSPEEALWAATRGGSLALELPDRGRLGPEPWPTWSCSMRTPTSISYRPDADHTWKVVKRGVVVSG